MKDTKQFYQIRGLKDIEYEAVSNITHSKLTIVLEGLLLGLPICIETKQYKMFFKKGGGYLICEVDETTKQIKKGLYNITFDELYSLCCKLSINDIKDLQWSIELLKIRPQSKEIH